MRSKTSFFSRALFVSQLRRFWPIYVGYFAAVAVSLPIALSSTISNLNARGVELNDIQLETWSQILKSGAGAGVVISLIFGVIFAMAAFGFMYNSASVSMVCALPYKRTGVFASLFTPGLCGMLLSNILAFLIALAVCAASGLALTGVLLQWLAIMCLLNLFFYGFAALCASFTGHILVLPAVYLVLNFTAYVVEYFVEVVLQTFVYGLSMAGGYGLSIFSPAVRIVMGARLQPISDASDVIVGWTYAGWTALIIYGIVGVLFALCAMQLIKHRRMEAAKDVIAVKPLRPVFKYCMTFGCALVIGVGLYYLVMGMRETGSGMSTMLTMLAFMLLGAFVGYFGSEMLLKKTLRVFKGSVWAGFAVSVAIITGLMLCNEYDVFGYERYVPQTELISSVSINCNGEYASFTDEEDIDAVRDIHSSIISHKDINEAPYAEGSYYDVSIHYQLDDGYDDGGYRYVERRYNVRYPETDDIQRIVEQLNTPEGIASRYRMDFPENAEIVANADIDYLSADSGKYESLSLTSAEAVEFYEDCILPDMEQGSIGQVRIIYEDDAFAGTTYDCNISFYFFDSAAQKQSQGMDYASRYVSLTPTVDSTRTNAWLKEHGINAALISEAGYEDIGVGEPAAEGYFGYDPTDPDDVARAEKQTQAKG